MLLLDDNAIKQVTAGSFFAAALLAESYVTYLFFHDVYFGSDNPKLHFVCGLILGSYVVASVCDYIQTTATDA